MDEITSIEYIQKLVLEGFTDWRKYGHVTVRKQDDLLLFNYNTMAQYEARWNFFERFSRGLIINTNTGEIVARGFDKFYGWLEGGRSSDGHIVCVMEKADGSCGFVYRTPAGFKIATRGSFDGKQALWATHFLNERYNLEDLPEELTLILEIIYPDNRVIVDYGEREDLVLLAARNRFTGDYLPFSLDVVALANRYGFSLPKRYPFTAVEEILRHLDTLDATEEGFVAEFSDGNRFKFKGRQYLELQRLVISLTFKNVLTAMESGNINAILDVTPDEFLGQTRQWITEIQQAIATTRAEIQAIFDLAPKTNRKDFALWVQTHHKNIAQYLFAMFDNRDIEPLIYKHYPWGNRDESLKE